MEYFISVGNDKRGPYSKEELKARGITSMALVMPEGSDNWIPAWQIEDLRDVISVQSEPVVEPLDSPSATSSASRPASNNPGESYVSSAQMDNPFQQPGVGATSNYQQGRPVSPPKSPTERKSSGGCISKALILLVIAAVIAGIAIVTCPDEQAHKAVLTDVVSSAITDEATGEDSSFDNSDVVSKMFKQMSNSWTREVVAAAVDNLIHVDNHFLFSTGKVRFGGKENTVSLGVFGHVFTVDKGFLRKAAEAYYSKAERDVKENLKKKAEQMFNDNVINPAKDAAEDAINDIEKEIRQEFGDIPWDIDNGVDEESADSSSDANGF